MYIYHHTTSLSICIGWISTIVARIILFRAGTYIEENDYWLILGWFASVIGRMRRNCMKQFGFQERPWKIESLVGEPTKLGGNNFIA
jgi:hypothetical protein